MVHHREGVGNWEVVIDEVYRHLLCPPEFLVTLCPECHKKVEEEDK